MGIVDLLICLKGSLCHHLWSNRIESFFHNIFFLLKQKANVCIHTLSGFFGGGGGENCVFLSLFLQQKKKVSVAYSSFIWWRWVCWDAGNDLWFSKLQLWETECSFDYWRLEMSYYGGWHWTIFQSPSGVVVCWLTCPRKTLSLYSMGWTRVHSSPWGTSKRLCLFGQRMCVVWLDLKF